MRTIILFFTTVILFSCNSITKSMPKVNNDLAKYINEVYKTKEVSITKGIDINSNGEKKKFIQLTINNSEVINESNLDIIESDIFLHLYNSCTTQEQENTDEFKIEIIKNNESNIHVYTKSAQEKIKRSIAFIDLYNEKCNDKQYNAAKALFNTTIVDTSQINLSSTYEQIEKTLGKLKNYEIKGFELGETEFKGKSKKMIKLYCLLNYDKGKAMSTYTIDLDNSDERLLHFKIN